MCIFMKLLSFQQVNFLSAIFQCFGIPVSFLSLTMASVKLFYSQRLGIFADVDPSLKMILFVFPLILLQIMGPMFSLVLLATYFKALVILFVIFFILTQFFVIKCLYFKGKSYKYLEELYQPEPSETNTFTQAKGREESKSVFISAVLTAWITPCIVWSNNFAHKSYFLIISSLTSTLVHALCLIFIYIQTSLDKVSFLNFAPITHCIIKKHYYLHADKVIYSNEPLLNIIQICKTNNFCPIIQRVCTGNESPTDLLHQTIGPIIFFLFAISFMASVMFQFLGNYFTLFQWSKKVCCFWGPIVTSNLLQDVIKNEEDEKIDLLLHEVFKNDQTLLNQRDRLFDKTPIHFAAKSNSPKTLEKIVTQSGLIRNGDFENIVILLENNSKKTQNKEEKQEKIEQIITRILSSTTRAETNNRVWINQPMHKAILNYNLRLLCVLSTLGGHWGSYNGENQNTLKLFLSHFESEELDINWFSKWIIENAVDEDGVNLIFLAVEKHELKFWKFLRKQCKTVN